MTNKSPTEPCDHDWGPNIIQYPDGLFYFGCNLFQCRKCGMRAYDENMARQLGGVIREMAER